MVPKSFTTMVAFTTSPRSGVPVAFGVSIAALSDTSGEGDAGMVDTGTGVSAVSPESEQPLIKIKAIRRQSAVAAVFRMIKYPF
jgi:hypothetical protein